MTQVMGRHHGRASHLAIAPRARGHVRQHRSQWELKHGGSWLLCQATPPTMQGPPGESAPVHAAAPSLLHYASIL